MTPRDQGFTRRIYFVHTHKWDPDALVEWVSTTFSTSLAENLLTADGYERARNLYTQRRIKVEDWALSRPGWWATFEGWRTRHLADSFSFTNRQ